MTSENHVLDFDVYQRLAARTNNQDLTHEQRLSMLGLGLCGEAGECVELLKKHLFHGHPLDRDKMVKELGDVLWYLAGLAGTCGIPLGDVAFLNIKKLEARYPNGFTEKASQERAE